MGKTPDIGQTFNQAKGFVSSDNLIFILILCAGVFVTYLAALAIDALASVLEEKRPRAIWLLDAATHPFLMFILNIAIGVGLGFAYLPPNWRAVVDPLPTIILFINLLWFGYNFLQFFVINVLRRLADRMKKAILIMAILIMVLLLIVLFYQSYTALITSALLSLLFALIIQKIVAMRKPKLVDKVVIPKKMVISHVYISTAETHDKVSSAIELIKQAMVEVPDIGKDPQAMLSGFVPGAFDVMVKYFIERPENFDAKKNDVNLNIIKKLNENGIKISMM
jgi:hypothetical protein